MRFKELLEALQRIDELQEYLDTDRYGAWITDAGEIIQVSDAGHAHPAVQYAEKHNIDLNGYGSAYGVVFDVGWVRIVHQNFNTAGEIDIEGKPEDILKHWPKLVGTVQRADYVNLDIRQRKIVSGEVRYVKKFYLTFEAPFKTSEMLRKLKAAVGSRS